MYAKTLRWSLVMAAGTLMMTGMGASPDLVPEVQRRSRHPKGPSAPPAPARAETPSRAAVPADAVLLALDDLRQVGIFDRPFTRYLWCPGGDVLDVKAASIA